MDIQTKIGIAMLVWIIIASLLSMLSVPEERGSWSLVFWSSFVSLAVFLIL